MPNGQWYPPEWPDRIRALAAGELTPVEPRRAATVMLLRDSAVAGMESGADSGAAPGTAPGPSRDTASDRSPGRGRDTDSDRGTETGPGPGPARGTDIGPGPGPGRGIGTAPGTRTGTDTDTAPGRGAGPSVHMLRRRTSMAFAGGAYAYPGGGVDPRDAEDAQLGWAGPSRDTWAARLGTDPASAQAIVCAAVRETYEEAGVLLAGPDATTVVGDTTGDDWEADRQALVTRGLSFAEFLDRRGLVLRSDLLGAWARWITPEFEPRRYDTWFFVAMLPEGQVTRNASTEADRTVWISPAEAAAGYDNGELLMMPPTISTLRDLLPYGTAAEALAAAAGRDLKPVLAQARLTSTGELVLSWPGHDEFTKHIPAGGAV